MFILKIYYTEILNIIHVAFLKIYKKYDFIIHIYTFLF